MQILSNSDFLPQTIRIGEVSIGSDVLGEVLLVLSDERDCYFIFDLEWDYDQFISEINACSHQLRTFENNDLKWELLRLREREYEKLKWVLLQEEMRLKKQLKEHDRQIEIEKVERLKRGTNW